MADEKFLAIKNWEKRQRKMGKREWVYDYTDKDGHPDYSKLSAFQRYVLDGLQRLRGRRGENPENDVTWIAQALHMIGTDRPHLRHALGTLIARGFLIPTNQQHDSIEEKREEEKRIEKPKPTAPAEPVREMPKPREEVRPKIAMVGIESQVVEFSLPVWVPEEQWIAWEQMRGKLKPPRPLTNHARNLAVKKLEQLMNQGHAPRDVLEQSILNSWQGLFELKGGRNGREPSKTEQREQRNRGVVQDLARKLYGDHVLGDDDLRTQAHGNAAGDHTGAHLVGAAEILPPERH